MDISIVKGKPAHLEDCYEALIKSGIGKAYFLDFDARKILSEGLRNGEINVALDRDNRCIGFIWYQNDGAFGMHTYLHIIAVKEEYRGKGIGKKLIANFEESTFKDDDMIFLLAADFNEKARKLYESIGYRNVGIIPGFYKKGISEYLMCKSRLLE